MNFLKSFLILFCIFSFGVGFSQKQPNDSISKKIPTSIYTATQISTDLNSLLNTNKRLNLTSYNFLVLDKITINISGFTVPLYNISPKSSTYIYDTYNKKHQKSILESAFFNISDIYLPRTKESL